MALVKLCWFMCCKRKTGPCGYRMGLVTRAHMYAMFKAVQNMLMLTGCKYRGIYVPKTYILAKSKTNVDCRGYERIWPENDNSGMSCGGLQKIHITRTA